MKQLSLNAQKTQIESYLRQNVGAPDFNEKLTKLNNINFNLNKAQGEKARKKEIKQRIACSKFRVIY